MFKQQNNTNLKLDFDYDIDDDFVFVMYGDVIFCGLLCNWNKKKCDLKLVRKLTFIIDKKMSLDKVATSLENFDSYKLSDVIPEVFFKYDAIFFATNEVKKKFLEGF